MSLGAGDKSSVHLASLAPRRPKAETSDGSSCGTSSDDGHGRRRGPRAGWKRDGRHEKWGPHFHITLVRASYAISNVSDLARVFRAMAEILCPEVDVGQMAMPTASHVRANMVKLDVLCMLWERERMRRKRRRVWRALVVVRGCGSPPPNRTLRLPTSTVGVGEGGVASKATQLANMIMLETSKAQFLEYRTQVTSYTSDQGTERKIPPVPMGDATEVDAALRALRDCSLSFEDPDCRDMFFFMHALESPETLHIMFNAVQQACEALPEWQEYERMLKAVCKHMGDGGSKERLLEKSFGGAPLFVRQLVQRCRTSHVDWRWEYLEKALEQLVPVFPFYVKYFMPEHFDAQSSLIKLCTEAVKCEWFLPFSTTVLIFVHAVGKQASWCEGCYCHGDELTAAKYGSKRRKLLEGGGQCPWKGRRGVDFALGYVSTMCDEVRGASSAAYEEILLNVTPEVASRMSSVKQQLCERWCREVAAKLKFWRHIPHRVVGAFGQYLGYTKAEAKSAVQDSILEWDGLRDKSKAHLVCFRLLGESSCVALQLRAFAQSPDTDLHSYRDAFEVVQEYSLGSVVGRIVEAEHVRIKSSNRRGLTWTKPAASCMLV